MANISPSNFVFHWSSDRVIGFHNDYDLSNIDERCSEQRLSSREPTGAVPFTAVLLLTSQVNEHPYRHDAESFIWVLTCIYLRYEDGKLISKSR